MDRNTSSPPAVPAFDHPVTKIQLDLMAAHGCSNPGCQCHTTGIVFLSQSCHQGSFLDVSYKQGTGILVVSCPVCKGVIMQVKVAES